MRLPRELIQHLSDAIAVGLESPVVAKLKVPRHILAANIAEIITKDLQAEDRLDRDVEKLLASYEAEISGGGMDARKMFDLTKKKLAKDRGMVL